MLRLRRYISLLLVVAGVLIAPATAGAWTIPTDAGAAPGDAVASYCPAFPADPVQAVSDAAASGSIAVAASSFTYSGASTVAAGMYQVSVPDGAAGTYMEVQAQDSGGSWELISFAPTTSGAELVYLPAGPVRIGVYGATARTDTYSVTAVGGSSGDAAQYAAVACLNGAAAADQAHSDAGTIAADVTSLQGPDAATLSTLAATESAIDGDVSSAASTAHTDAGAIAAGITSLGGGKSLANLDDDLAGIGAGSSLATLDGDLAQLDSDVKQLHTDNGTIESDLDTIAAGTGGGTSTTSGTQDVSLTGPVQLSDADRQLESDIGGQLDMDLWAIVGVILAAVLGLELFRMWRS